MAVYPVFIDAVREKHLKIKEANVVYIKVKLGKFIVFYLYKADFESTNELITIEEIVASKLLYGEKCMIIPEKDMEYMLGLSKLDSLKVSNYIFESLQDYYDPKLIYSEEDLKGVDMQ
ncbi:MAG TPA: hypothetical protein VK190_02705 [Pseudoneobacillus sp.]|nr:hypothetical protein [Pseudoneobacillus sp.]